MADLAPVIKHRFFDANGNPLVGGKLYSYIAGTSTPKATFQDFEGTPNTNPIILDAAGMCNLRIVTGYYKFVLKDANDVTQFTADKVSLPVIAGNGVPVGGTTAQILAKNSGADNDVLWIDFNPLPSQATHAGKFLGTNGTVASWQTVDALPSQATHSGKYLTTNGTVASWAAVPSPIGANALQTLAAAGVITVGTNPIESVLVEGTSGVTSVTLPVPTIDRQILHIMGTSNANPVRIPQGTNVYQKEAAYTLNNLDTVSYMARTGLGRWIQIGGNV